MGLRFNHRIPSVEAPLQGPGDWGRAMGYHGSPPPGNHVGVKMSSRVCVVVEKLCTHGLTYGTHVVFLRITWCVPRNGTLPRSVSQLSGSAMC